VSGGQTSGCYRSYWLHRWRQPPSSGIENTRPNIVGSKNYLLIYFYLKLKIKRPGTKKTPNPNSSFWYSRERIILEALQEVFFPFFLLLLT